MNLGTRISRFCNVFCINFTAPFTHSFSLAAFSKAEIHYDWESFWARFLNSEKYGIFYQSFNSLTFKSIKSYALGFVWDFKASFWRHSFRLFLLQGGCLNWSKSLNLGSGPKSLEMLSKVWFASTKEFITVVFIWMRVLESTLWMYSSWESLSKRFT